VAESQSEDELVVKSVSIVNDEARQKNWLLVTKKVSVLIVVPCQNTVIVDAKSMVESVRINQETKLVTGG
jgi:hypothetical protein